MDSFKDLMERIYLFFLHFVKKLKYIFRACSIVWVDVLSMLICDTFIEKIKLLIKCCFSEKNENSSEIVVTIIC